MVLKNTIKEEASSVKSKLRILLSAMKDSTTMAKRTIP